jgi:thiosulfate/3-mercaptopyruvate sulfurtransferase
MLRATQFVLAAIVCCGGFMMANGSGLPGNTAGMKVNDKMLVSSGWLAAHLNDADLVILCVADDPAFYDRGHIAEARYIPLNRLVSQGATLNAIPPLKELKELLESVGVDQHSRIVIYGEKLGMLAARAYVTLDYVGLANRASLLDGGIEKWRVEKRPETTDSAKIKFTSLEFHLNPDVVETLEGVKSHLLRRDALLLDARPTAEFTGEKRSEDVPRSGHIAGAGGLYWVDLLTSRELPTLRPPDELMKAYRAAGAIEGKQVVSYCRTGMQASVDYFVSKYLGFPSSIYVSSFYEWSRSDAAVEVSPASEAVAK